MPAERERIRVNGIEVEVGRQGDVYLDGGHLGSVVREQRLGQWFWRAREPGGEALKRFLTSRPEAILLLLLHADVVDGIGF